MILHVEGFKTQRGVLTENHCCLLGKTPENKVHNDKTQ